jgi:hypothetical protein
MNLYQHLIFLIPALFFLLVFVWCSKRRYCSDFVELSGIACLMISGLIFACWIINMIDVYDVLDRVHKFYIMLGTL